MAIDKHTIKMTVKEFTDMKPEIGLDPTFQVGSISEGRWGLKDKRSFIDSVINGMNISKIIVIDLHACLKSTKTEGDDDWKYFKYWIDEGYNHLSLDGNNRTICLHDFVNDKFNLRAHSKYEVEKNDGRVSEYTIGVDNAYYSDLQEGLRDKISNDIMDVTFITQATIKEISKLFVGVNSGKPLNGAEIRNAMITFVSKYVRETATKYKVAFESSITHKSMIRMSHYEALTSWMVHFSHAEDPITIDNTSLNSAYESHSAEERNIRAFNKMATPILQALNKHTIFNSQKYKKFNLLNFFYLCSHLHSLQYTIKDVDAFIEWFAETERERLMSSEHIHTNKKGYLKQYEELTGDEAISIEVRLKTMMKDVVSSTLEKDLIIVNIDKDRIATTEQRHELWKKQNGKCAITGVVIPVTEIVDGSKWQADHIIPYSEGGKTTVENMRLISYEAHKEVTRNFLKKTA